MTETKNSKSSKDDRTKTREQRRAERSKLRRTNKEIMSVSYVVILLFVGMIAYLGYFTVHDAKRLTLLEDKYIRGEIQASDGTTLAASVTEDGKDTRYYPYGKTFAHVVGYSYNGVTGIESQGASYLLNSHTNPLIRIIEALRGIKSSGDTVITTLDVNLQQTAYQAMSDHNGAVVVMEPTTGRILAMVSRPGFDPNTLPDEWEDLVSDSGNSNLVNRATQGLYTPGSTFKILTALEYMRENPSSWPAYTFDCDGTYTVEDYTINCSKKKSHGEQDLREAFANSCNGAFAALGQQLSFSRFYNMCGDFGFNGSLGTRVPTATSKFELSNNNSTWKILQTSIGQGDTQITPMLNCLIVSAVANNGVMMNPYLIDSVVTKYGDRVASFAPAALRTVMTTAEAAEMEKMMEKVVKEGTGSEAQGSGYTVAGKTGSAETGKDVETNAWFVGYATDDENKSRQIAVSIVLEEGGSGGQAAAPIAKKIFDAWDED